MRPAQQPHSRPTTTLAVAADPAAASLAAPPAATAAVHALNEHAPLVSVGLSYSNDFPAMVAAIGAEASIERLRSFAEECRQQEGSVRTPLALLQLLTLVRQFECTLVLDVMTAARRAATTASTSVLETSMRRSMQQHGQ